MARILPLLLLLGMVTGHAQYVMPPVPVPPENPVTEAKRILGKLLFWDEQLSADQSMACGTCHRPGNGGADPRAGIFPGIDPGTIDNVRGSPGLVAYTETGEPTHDPVFGYQPQVTPRNSLANFGALWAAEIFWDGRAGSEFIDPQTGRAAIRRGGALENQALMALSNPAEMALPGQSWHQLAGRLAAVRPLALASNLPLDMAIAVRHAGNYPALFEAAFGDPDITAIRIAFALATYQRTLVADQTPWDRFQRGDQAAMPPAARAGWRDFEDFHCADCHVPPLFTNNDFMNIGLRLSRFDAARMGVTGDPEDAGEVKVPSLRNVALRPRFMHTGQFPTLEAAIGFYRNSAALPDRDRLPNGGVYAFNMGAQTELNLFQFLRLALTDPRVSAETWPFDRPTLRSESQVPPWR